MTDPMTLTRESGYTVWKAWRDGMLAQGRHVAPERMAWETLDERDHVLDAAIEAAVRAEQSAKVERLRAALQHVQLGLHWAVFKNVPQVERSNEMRELREAVDAALAATPATAERCAFVGCFEPTQRDHAIHKPYEGKWADSAICHPFQPEPVAPSPAVTEPVGTMTDDEWAEWSDAIAPEPRP